MNPVNPSTPASSSPSLSGELGVTPIVMMVIATAAPLTVMAANTPLMIGLGNGAAAPFDALVAMLIMFMFSVGFVAISRHIGNAGAFYACIQKGLGRVTGLGAATLAMVSYSLFLLAIGTYVGYASSELLHSLTGLNLPWWLLTLAAIAIIGVLGYRRIEMSSRFLGIALILEIAVVLLLNALIVADKGLGGLPAESFQPSHILSGSPGLGILFAIYSFIGFESTVIYREEARDPERTIPIATYTAVFTVGIFYVLSMWCTVAGIGADKVVAFANEHPGDMYLLLSEQYLGKAFSDVIQVLLITSLFACMLSLHNIVVRYQYILGKYTVLPERFASIHRRHGSPYVASLAQSTFATLGTLLLVLIGLDPITQIYAWGATAGTLGYMVILALASLAILAFFRREGSDRRLWHTRIAPLGGLLGILACLAIAIHNLPMLIGGDNAGEVAPLMGLLVVLAFAIGGLCALLLRGRSPQRYQALRELA
ncbi:APC family permease [Pseudomonas sp. ABC1]|uniref:APC family permease n=1 Tax=Pseudomonas sp. ABC1 TaxID=2748080 RepID=UPI0015C3383E|nr:APC family permease [Pseudomonas sp. ABC1]QLF91928.1 APC family permease [Pseudomonas sp. ABC1]